MLLSAVSSRQIERLPDEDSTPDPLSEEHSLCGTPQASDAETKVWPPEFSDSNPSDVESENPASSLRHLRTITLVPSS
jgi:hypothetical protein